MSTKKLKLTEINIEGGTQIRQKLCTDTVSEYAEAYEAGVKLPPLRVCYDGKTYWLYDGFHRWHARRKAGASHVEVEVFKGTLRDARQLAAGANSDHGLRRTNEDKRAAVLVFLEDEEWVLWSDNRIAEAAGVSVPFVSKIRGELLTVNNSQAAKSVGKPRTGKDGKQYPAKSKGNAVADYFDKKNSQANGSGPKQYNDRFDPAELDEPKKQKVHRADADMPPMQLDETGAEVPKQLIGVFERREQFRKASRMVLDAAGIVKVLKGETAGRYLTDEADCLEHLASEIEASMPHSVDGRTWRCARG